MKLLNGTQNIWRYHLKDAILGKIYFLLVRVKIKNMELEIRRRESTGSGPNTYVETETLAKFELMDGAPVRGTHSYIVCKLFYNTWSDLCLVELFWNDSHTEVFTIMLLIFLVFPCYGWSQFFFLMIFNLIVILAFRLWCYNCFHMVDGFYTA